MRKLTLILALAIAIAFAGAAYAEVQNVKVSGDITIYQTKAWYDTFYRSSAGVNDSTADYFWLANLGVNIDADLTENVGTHIRVVNMRPWDLDDADATAMDIGVAEAYISLKEMLYEPLTVTIGRQPLFYGRGFIIGSNVIDPEGSVGLYDQYSLYDAFDAVKAELDYEPWKIDAVYSLISEENLNENDDIHLWLINVGYTFDQYNAEVEGYYVGLRDRNRTDLRLAAIINPAGAPVQSYYTDATIPAYETHTFGLRGSLEPIDNLSLFGEAAYQFGDLGDVAYDIRNTINGVTTRDVGSWGAEVGGEYLFADVTGEPKIGITYSFREGEDFNNYGYASGDYDAFYTPFMRRSDTAIFGHNGRYGIGNVAAPAGGVASNLYYKNGDFANSVDDDDTAWDTNMHQILVAGSIKPLAYWNIEDVNLGLKYAWFRFDDDPINGTDTDAGDELDMMLSYDYTEDVQFNLLWAYFWPGDYYDRGQPQNQADAEDTLLLETSVKVIF
jgi:hypothetical protein